MSHANISIFVPHIGCPNMCSFCNQHSITGRTGVPSKEDIDSAVLAAKTSKNYDAESTEIAFFGGSFTGIDRELMIELLSAANSHIKNGSVSGIRISTRPDFVDNEVLEILKTYGVTAIELGAQSMCDEVLYKNRRGHTANDVKIASKLIKKAGFELGLQMMTGLYGSNDELDRETAKAIIALKPETIRIYPAITLKDTYLESLYKSGEYLPPKLEDAVSLCDELLEMFEKAGIKVIRVGLHTIEDGSYVAGPWHPAFKELCDSKRMLEIAKQALSNLEKGEYVLRVCPKSISKMTGNKRQNLAHLETLGYICKVKADEKLKEYQIIPERMNNSCF